MNTQTTTPDQIFGYDVLDSAGNKIGSVDNVWVDDATNALEFIGVKTGWLLGKTHVIPVENANISDGTITVPFAEDQIKDAPSFGGDDEISPDAEDEIYSYYGMDRSTSASPTGLSTGDTSSSFSGRDMGTEALESDSSYAAASGADTGVTSDYTTSSSTDYGATGTDTDTQALSLSEEELQVGKREVEAGRVRLRKVVNTEHQEVPVELRREQVQVERIDATDADVPSSAFEEQEIEVPVMREEAVVGKESRVTGGVRLNKNVETETRSVGGDVRREDVQVEGADDTALSSDSTDNATDSSRNY